MPNPKLTTCLFVVAVLLACAVGPAAHGQEALKNRWEITPESERALQMGLEYLARSQGDKGNWNNEDLGLVSLGMLAFLADGHAPGHGKYGPAVKKSLDYIMANAKPSGLLNIPGHQEMYNHGLTTFVLGQAYGMTDDRRVGPALDRALKLIAKCQGPSGGWDYTAAPGEHDLSLCVMQAKALRSAVDSGFEVPPAVIEAAIGHVRGKFASEGWDGQGGEEEQKKHPGRFTYAGNIGGGSVAMAAAGVVCLQELGQYDDWRIAKSIDFIEASLKDITDKPGNNLPFDAYTMYYVAQSLYQVGGEPWKRSYPKLRDRVVISQTHTAAQNGSWGGDLFTTSVCCFVVAIPNRYLPILQEGKIDSVRKQLEPK